MPNFFDNKSRLIHPINARHKQHWCSNVFLYPTICLSFDFYICCRICATMSVQVLTMNPINSEWPFFCSYFCQVLGLDGVHWQGTVYSALPGQRRDNTKLLVYYITKSLFTLYAKFDTLKFHQLGVLIT